MANAWLYIGQDIRAQREAEAEKGPVRELLARPFHNLPKRQSFLSNWLVYEAQTDLPEVPGSPRVEEDAASDVTVGAAAGIHHAHLPVSTIRSQRGNGMPKVDLVGASGESMEHYEHGPAVVGAHLGELVVGKVGRPRGKRLVDILVEVDGEVDGKGARVSPVVGVEYLPAVVYGRAVLLDGSPHGLEMAVEQQRVELAWRNARFADLHQVGGRSVLPRQGQRQGRVSESDLGTAEPVHGSEKEAPGPAERSQRVKGKLPSENE